MKKNIKTVVMYVLAILVIVGAIVGAFFEAAAGILPMWLAVVEAVVCVALLAYGTVMELKKHECCCDCKKEEVAEVKEVVKEEAKEEVKVEEEPVVKAEPKAKKPAAAPKAEKQ